MQFKWKFGHVTNTGCPSLLNRQWTPNKVQKRKAIEPQFNMLSALLNCTSHRLTITIKKKKKTCWASVWRTQFCMKTQHNISFGSTFVNVLLNVSSNHWHVNSNMHNKHEQLPTTGLLNSTLFRHNPRKNNTHLEAKFCFVPNSVYSDTRNWQTNEQTTQWRTVLEKLVVPQLINIFPAFYGNRRFLSAFTRARSIHSTLSWPVYLDPF